MSTSDVTKGGLTGARPGRDALTGAKTGRPSDARDRSAEGQESGAPGGTGAQGAGERVGAGSEPRTKSGAHAGNGPTADKRWAGAAGHGRRKGGDRPEFTSYYGRPVITAPVWEPLDIAGYLFLGGLAGASSALAAGAQATGRPALARPAKLGAALAGATSLLALVHDLGRPSRFVNMLRVFKPTSPMSVGSWLLAGYVPAAAVAASSDVTGRLPRLGALATVAAALAGPAVASYTAVLISDTAVPAWHDARRQMPFVFVSSGASAAGGFGLATAPLSQSGPARRLAVAAAASELVLTRRMRRRMGMAAEAYEGGRAGQLVRASEVLTLGGAAAALLGRRSRWASVIAGAALLAGSACTRFGIFEAGLESARDPRYTVVPQRQRLDRSEVSSPGLAGPAQ